MGDRLSVCISVPGFVLLIRFPFPEEQDEFNKAEAHAGEQEEEDIFQEPVMNGMNRMMHHSSVSLIPSHWVS